MAGRNQASNCRRPAQMRATWHLRLVDASPPPRRGSGSFGASPQPICRTPQRLGSAVSATGPSRRSHSVPVLSRGPPLPLDRASKRHQPTTWPWWRSRLHCLHSWCRRPRSHCRGATACSEEEFTPPIPLSASGAASFVCARSDTEEAAMIEAGIV